MPANNGLLLQRPEFLATLRSETERAGTLLIFDEVISGFRLARGGAAELLGITPDLATFGKVIGGGLPVGAFGGRRDLMKHLAPLGGVYQAGTLSGNAVAMSAGLAALRALEREDGWRRLEETGRQLEALLAPVLARAPFGASFVRSGSLFWLSLQGGPAPRSAEAIDPGGGRSLPADLPRAARRGHRDGAVRVRVGVPVARAHPRAPRAAARRARRGARRERRRWRPRMIGRDSQRVVRATQIGFIVLLLACSAQLAYWMEDEYRYTETVREHRRAAYEQQARTSAELLRAGVPWAAIAPSQPEVELGADGVPRVSAAMLAQLDADRFHRMNRYAWEGTFFLLVLVAAMGVVYAALREEHALRRQQADFLAAASHELKSPLASLRLSAETLAMRDPAPPRRAELVGRLLSDIGRLDQMIANVLDASRLSRDHVRTTRERLALESVVVSVADELRPLADDCGVTVRVDVGAGLTIDADREGVRTIARNLIHNGIKAARASGGTVTVCARADAGRVTVRVEDDGIGFAPGESRGLFQKFHRIEANGHERLPGTGLGLFLVRRCAEIDGAEVSAESEGPGRGARFEVRWPALRSAEGTS